MDDYALPLVAHRSTTAMSAADSVYADDLHGEAEYLDVDVSSMQPVPLSFKPAPPSRGSTARGRPQPLVHTASEPAALATVPMQAHGLLRQETLQRAYMESAYWHGVDEIWKFEADFNARVVAFGIDALVKDESFERDAITRDSFVALIRLLELAEYTLQQRDALASETTERRHLEAVEAAALLCRLPMLELATRRGVAFAFTVRLDAIIDECFTLATVANLVDVEATRRRTYMRANDELRAYAVIARRYATEKRVLDAVEHDQRSTLAAMREREVALLHADFDEERAAAAAAGEDRRLNDAARRIQRSTRRFVARRGVSDAVAARTRTELDDALRAVFDAVGVSSGVWCPEPVAANA